MSLEELDDDHLLGLYIAYKEGEQALRLNVLRKLETDVGKGAAIKIIRHLVGRYMVVVGTGAKIDGNFPRWTYIYKIPQEYRESLSKIPDNKPDVYKRFLKVPDKV